MIRSMHQMHQAELQNATNIIKPTHTGHTHAASRGCSISTVTALLHCQTARVEASHCFMKLLHRAESAGLNHHHHRD